jgi:predicted dehydrogenase
MYRFAIIGLGNIARKFAADLKLVEGATLTSVASRSQEWADAFAEEFHVRYAAGSYEKLFEGPHLHAVYIATPHVSHAELVKMCMDHDIPVICEKPMGINLTEVQELVNIARHKKVYLMEALWTRFLPSFQAAKRHIDAGAIGKVEGLRADFGFKMGPQTRERITKLELGGGALLDIGIYPVFLAQVMFGPPTTITAVARFSESGVDVDDTIVLEHEGGILATLHCTLLAKTKTEAVIYGSEGTLYWDELWYKQSDFTIKKDNSEEELRYVAKPRGFGYAHEAQAMVEDLRQGRTESPLWSLDDSLTLHTTLTKIRELIGLKYPME